jgi:hypothetical protein
MRFPTNSKLATRISIIMTVIFIAGMLLLWRFVSENAVSIVGNDITNYMTAFAMGSEVHQLRADPQNPELQSIKMLMDDIAAASVRQTEMIAFVEEGIKEISGVVQTNSSIAEESAAVSRELSEQARTLNGLISQFRIS